MISCKKRLLLCGLVLHIVCIPFGYAAPQHSDNLDSSCLTSDNKQGICIESKRCKKFQNLLTSKTIITPDIKDFFRKNKCGWNNNEPKVCCADICSSSVSIDSRSKVKSKPAQCGRLAPNYEKVMGERPASLGSWPWMVALGYREWSNRTIVFRCSASLIADEWLLTAANCVEEKDTFLRLTTARLGDLDLDDKVKDNATPVDVRIGDTFIHPQYFDDRQNYNVALLQLKNPVNFTTLIQPICLLSGAQFERDRYYKRRSPFVIGWDLTSDGHALREAVVNMQELNECSNKYTEIGGKTFTDNLLCTGKDSCQGDSGSPLMFLNTSEFRMYLGGIVSAGEECARDYPGIYMKVAKFITWINEVTGINF